MAEIVTINYKVLVENLQSLEEFKRKHQEASQQVDEMKAKLDNASKSHEKHNDVLLKGRKAIQDFRKEIFLLTFAVGTATAILAGLAKSSNSLTAQMERGATELQRFGKNLGDLVAFSGFLNQFIQSFKFLADQAERLNKFTQARTGKQPAASAETMNFMDSLRAKTLSLQGDTAGARALELQVEFLTKIQPMMERLSGTVRQDLFNAWKDYERASTEALRRSELGLKNNLEIMRDFKRSFAGAFGTGAADPIYKALEGQKQSLMDVLNGFTSPIKRAFADAIGEGFKSYVFGGGNLMDGFKGLFGMGGNEEAKRAAQDAERARQQRERMIDNLNFMRQCGCQTASNTGNMLSMAGAGKAASGVLTATVEAGSVGGIGKLAQLAGGIGGLFKGIGGLASLSGLFGKGAGISIGAGGGDRRIHSGGFVGAFATGGEVPALVQPGEFVVRKEVARNDREFLREYNVDGRRSKKGGQNVFVIKANDAPSFMEMLSRPSARAAIEMAVVRAVMGNGSVRNVIKDFTR